MSIWKDIEGFFAKIFSGNTQNEIKIAKGVLLVVTSLVETIAVETAGEAEAAAIANVTGQIQADLSAVYNLIGQTGQVPSAINILNSVKANINTLLTDGQIKNPTTLKTVEGIATTVIDEVESIITALGGVASTTSTTPAPAPTTTTE